MAIRFKERNRQIVSRVGQKAGRDVSGVASSPQGTLPFTSRRMVSCNYSEGTDRSLGGWYRCVILLCSLSIAFDDSMELMDVPAFRVASSSAAALFWLAAILVSQSSSQLP